MAMPRGLSIACIIALVNCLAKILNFCINEVGEGMLMQPLNVNTRHIMNCGDGFVPMETGHESGILVPHALMDSGHHFHNIPRNVQRQCEHSNPEVILSWQ
jgi:hypothetical protein